MASVKLSITSYSLPLSLTLCYYLLDTYTLEQGLILRLYSLAYPWNK